MLANSWSFVRPSCSNITFHCLIQILESQLSCLRALSLQFEVMPLVKHCEEAINRFKLNKKSFDSGNNVELAYPTNPTHCYRAFPFGLPVDVQRLKQLHLTGEYSDVNIYIEGNGLVSQPHKIILSLWSVPFTKVSQTSLLFC